MPLNRFRALSLALIALATYAGIAGAADGVMPYQEYGKRIKGSETVSPLGDDLFGDQMSLYNGGTEFTVTDIDIPGNNGLPVRLTRRLQIEDRKKQEYFAGFGEWEVDIPHLYGTFDGNYKWTVESSTPNNRCSSGAGIPRISNSSFQTTKVWSGNQMHIPGESDRQVLSNPSASIPALTDGNTYPYITKDFYRIRCKTTTANGYPGEAFIAISPAGLKYTFDIAVERSAPTLREPANEDWLDFNALTRKRVYMMASRVEDRHGNWVAYNYTGDKLTGITASDGRSISLGYSGATIQSATAAGRTWTYEYRTSSDIRHPGPLLSKATLPDGSTWEYGSAGNLWPDYLEAPASNEPVPTCPEPEAGIGQFQLTAKHPSGARGEFNFAFIRHYRGNIPNWCVSEQPGYQYLVVPNFFDSYSLLSKRLSGPGIADQLWSYDYQENQEAGFPGDPGPCNGCISEKNVVVTEPSGRKVTTRLGILFDSNEGWTLGTSIQKSSGEVVKTETLSYVEDASMPSMPFANIYGHGIGDSEAPMQIRPLRQRQISLDGVTYTYTVNTFDSFARPVSMTRSSNISYGYSRTDSTEYHDDLSKWVLGQVKRSYTGGVEVSETEFTSNAQPYRTFRYNDATPVQTLTYNADGTVATVKDGNNNVITLSNWKRGIPQTIQYPATPESPSGSTESAVVNDSGWITSVTDENGTGYTTNYGYDAMGRVSSVAYPTGDSVGWNTLARSFEQVNQEEFGIPAGHWRQVTTQGNYQKVTIFDALWRPLWEYQRDLSNNDATFSLVGKSYDPAGRLAFASYPRNPYADGNWAIDTGTRTTYDALGRVIKVEQNSELGMLTTTTQYLNGGETLVTNPRNQQLRTRYAAWDQPTTDYPIEIFHPEGAFTQIWRDYFLKPTQIRRSGTYAGQTVEAIRKYEYDALQRLCRVDEPETGSTVTGYDYNDNLTWSASGLTTLAATGCEHMAAYQSGRRSDRVYDARNRLSALSFPDGLGNQTWTYTKDGLPTTITTYNGAGNTAAVVNSYGYNKRRLLTSETISEPGLYTWPLGYGYDPNGNLAAQTYPTGLALTYSPNALGQATQVSTSAGSTTAGTYATGVSYYPNGAIKQFTYGNGVLHAMSQNARQLPDTVSDIGVAGYTYTYDKNGNATQIVDNGQGANFNRYLSYDGLDRLTSAGSAMFGGSTHYISYGYDAIDNIRSVSHPGVREHSYWYNAKNQLTNVQNSGGASVIGLSYNPQGNLEYKNNQQYGFDYGNRLRWVAGKESYRYDGLGRRTKIAKDNGDQQWHQYSQAGQYLFNSKLTAGGVQTTQEIVYLAGSAIATIDHNWPSNTVIATKYQHTDALGSPVATTNNSGALIERTNYEPYGSAINKTVDGIGYTGHVMDGATGLTYMQQRYYDGTLGRFLSVDPVTAYEKPSQNFNRYWYGNNNPYSFKDPDGREVGYTYNSDGSMYHYYMDHEPDPAAAEVALALWPAARGIRLLVTAVRIIAKVSEKKSGPDTKSSDKNLPERIYRAGTKDNPAHVTTREGEEAVSFRSSLSNPANKEQAVFTPGRNYIAVDPAKLPAGSVTADGGKMVGGKLMPDGHVSVRATPEQIVEATVGGGKLPKK